MTQREPHDDSLDRLLAHLNSIEPGHDFSERTLHGIAVRQAKRKRSPTLWLRWSFAGTAALAAAFAGIAIGLHQPAAPPDSVAPRIAAEVPPPLARTATRPSFEVMPAGRRTARLRAAAESKEAADFPPPEAPLTEEERLLLRVARHPDPEQVATLNPEERAELELRDQVAFQRFFDPEPRPKKANN